MTFSVQIYLTPGSSEIGLLDNEVSSLVTIHGTPAAYWEYIVAVTDSGCDILDLRANEDAACARQPTPGRLA